MPSEYFLEMSRISKTFSGVKVLDDIDFNIRPGEIRALVGENGAGKSTLMKILGGIYQRDKNSGSIKINGTAVDINSAADATRLGISIIHQEIHLADNMSVYDNMFMGSELLMAHDLFLDDNAMIRKAQIVIDDMGMDLDVREKVKDLSIARQQMVEISRSLLSDAKLIVMDEPTSSLTENEIEQLFSQIRKLKSTGIAIIYISHRMPEIFKLSDTITVLRDGQLIGTDLTSKLDERSVISMMVGREISEIYGLKPNTSSDEIVLSVKDLCNTKIHNIEFDLRKGEILGFAGLIGAGRSELARAIFGIDKLDSGEIYVNGQKVEIHSPAQAIQHKISYVPENRKTEGLFLTDSVSFNITIPVLNKIIRFIGIKKYVENSIINKFIHALNIKLVSEDQKVMFLSGGNQQKILVSKWLATNPDILILDEPTRGIDIGSKSEIYHLMGDLVQKGVAIIFISSEIEEIINLSDRIMVMNGGKIFGELDNPKEARASQEKIMWFASGGRDIDGNI